MRILYAGGLGPEQLALVRCEALEATGVEVHRYDFGPYVDRLRTQLVLRALSKLGRAPLMRAMNRELLEERDHLIRALRPDR